MTELSPEDVTRLIATANEARWRARGMPSAVASIESSEAERQLDALFHIGRTLAVYGTLAPGRSNHHVVAPLGGEWTDGIVEGDLSPIGWGATLGYPAFSPRVGGPRVAVHVLRSPALPGAWSRLDEFEGPGYRRVLVPVWRAADAHAQRPYAVANLYAAADGPPAAR